MKTTNSYLSACLMLTLWGHSVCLGQSNIVYYGSNSNAIGVCFADSNLLASAQSSIVSDMQLCLNNWGKLSELHLGVHVPGFVGQLYNSKRCPHYPDSIDFPENVVLESADFSLRFCHVSA